MTMGEHHGLDLAEIGIQALDIAFEDRLSGPVSKSRLWALSPR
jgi:hypothetical protein